MRDDRLENRHWAFGIRRRKMAVRARLALSGLRSRLLYQHAAPLDGVLCDYRRLTAGIRRIRAARGASLRSPSSPNRFGENSKVKRSDNRPARLAITRRGGA
jgi:hypothetical protein